jgi:two-component system sensor histidine kinase BarA
MGPGVELRLLLLSVLPAVIITVLMAGYLIDTRVTDLDRALQERGDVVVRQLATAAAHSIELGDAKLLESFVNAALLENDVVEVAIQDRQGRLLASARRDDPALLAVAAGDAFRLTFTVPVHALRNPVASQQTPATVGNETIGMVSIAMSHGLTEQAQRDTFWFALRISAGSLLLAAIIAYRMGKTISSPILSLTAAISRLTQGRLDTRADFPATRELADLRDGFNAMAAELERHQNRLQQQIADSTDLLHRSLVDLERQNRELESARKQAELQTEIKSQFLAHMSHEIRTPMNGIIGFTELIAQTPLSEEQREKLKLIERSAHNLLTIINEVLDLSKAEAGQVTLNEREFGLRNYLEDTVALAAAASPHVPIVLWVDPAAPGCLTADPVRLQQVVANLLTNAVKSTEQGRVVIRVRTIGAGAKLLISVSDSGRGIAEQDLENLFFPFLQLSRYAINHERGTGLGLTIARNIVTRMGGRIGVGSREGRGTTFWFTVPFKKCCEARSPQAVDAAPVALVDFDRVSAQATRFQLEALGYSVRIIASAEQWLCMPWAPTTAVVLQTAGLEDKSGYPLNEWIDQVCSRDVFPVLLLENANERRQSGYRERGAICLPQPVGSEKLRAALRSTHENIVTARGAVDTGAESLPSPFGDLHVLVADDNEINRILLRAQLIKLGAEVDDARDGGEALEMLEIQPYDLVFIDLQMPVMDGLEVIEEVAKRQGPNSFTPMLAITAHAQPGQRQLLLNRGFVDCLIKPITVGQLTAAVTAVLESPDPESFPEYAAYRKHAVTLLERAYGDRAIAITVAKKLFAELPIQLEAIRSLLDGGSFSEAAHESHKVHGSASFCGLEELRRAAKALESKLLDPDAEPGYWPLFDRFTDEIERLLFDSTAILAELSNTTDGQPARDGQQWC